MTLKVSIGRKSNATHFVTAFANLVEETAGGYKWMYKSEYNGNC